MPKDNKTASLQITLPPLFASEDSRKLGLLTSPAQALKKIQAWQKEDDQKLLRLCSHYKIATSPRMFEQLALVLARELYPAKKKSGRKTKWVEAIKGMLVVEIERLVDADNTSHGVEWACKQLSTREPWKSFLEKKESEDSSIDPAEALRKIYFDFKKNKLAAVTRKAFKYHERESTIAEWEKLIVEFVSNPHPK